MNDNLIDFAENIYADHPEFEDMDASEIFDLVLDIISNDDYYIEQLNQADENDENDFEYNRSLDDVDFDIEATAKKVTKLIIRLRREEQE